MKYPYFKLFTIFFAALLLLQAGKINAQCPGGFPNGNVAYDTSIVTPTGMTSMLIKFPKFDPTTGMLTCVRLCISITAVVDSVSVENNSISNQTADVYYTRTDIISGPGLVSPLMNIVNHHYGPYPLAGTDGVMGSGPDFMSIAHDTIQNAVSQCRTISDSATIAQFYGTDSVSYNYNITALTSAVCTGDYNSSISTSARVRFRFEYCTCPSYTLPINIYNFNVEKVQGNKAQIKWNSFDNGDVSNYHYEIEMSRNGRDFQMINTVMKNENNSNEYASLYNMTGSGRYFFRVRQVSSNGKTYFTGIKYLDIESGPPAKFIVYPNPSNGIVGIKFDNISAGKYSVLINNALGQTVVKKEIEVSGNVYKQVATLQPGSYWVKLVDEMGRFAGVHQLLIK